MTDEDLMDAQHQAEALMRDSARLASVEAELAAAHSALALWREAVADHRRELARLHPVELAARAVVAASHGVRLPMDTGKNTAGEELWGALLTLRAILPPSPSPVEAGPSANPEEILP